eukprot:12091475-Heterocapsa_arctica.AAC.1
MKKAERTITELTYVMQKLGYTKYTQKCADGTMITTTNVSGSQFDFESIGDCKRTLRLGRQLPSTNDGMDCVIWPAKLRKRRMDILVDQEELLCWSGR